MVGREEDDAAGQPGEKDGAQPFRPAGGVAADDEEHRRQRRGAGDEGDRQRHDERFALDIHVLGHGAHGGREDHLDGDEEEDDAAGHGQRRFGDVEQFEKELAAEEEEDQGGEGEEELADDDASLPVSRVSLEGDEKERDVAYRVHDQKKEQGCGEKCHTLLCPPPGRGCQALPAKPMEKVIQAV